MMDNLKDEEVAINLKLWKLSRFYHMLKPNNTKIFNCNFHRLIFLLYGAIENCVVAYSTSGFFFEMDDIISDVDIFLAAFITISFFVLFWRMYIILRKRHAICDMLNVSQFNFLTSEKCRQHLDVLYCCRDKTIKITNYLFVFSVIVFIQWIIYPIMVTMFTVTDIENSRLPNILSLRFPVLTRTYNQNY